MYNLNETTLVVVLTVLYLTILLITNYFVYSINLHSERWPGLYECFPINITTGNTLIIGLVSLIMRCYAKKSTHVAKTGKICHGLDANIIHGLNTVNKEHTSQAFAEHNSPGGAFQ